MTLQAAGVIEQAMRNEGLIDKDVRLMGEIITEALDAAGYDVVLRADPDTSDDRPAIDNARRIIAEMRDRVGYLHPMPHAGLSVELLMAVVAEADVERAVRSYGIMPSSRPEDDDLDRAAAARLRQLTDETPFVAKYVRVPDERDELRRQLDTLRNALLDAIGDPDELRRVAVSVARDRKVTSAEAERRIGLLTRIAAAVGDREERPAQCPECGSDDPATRLPVKRPEVHIEGGARVCRFCNRTLTFNFMRNDGGDCDCARAVEDAACSGSWHDVEVSR